MQNKFCKVLSNALSFRIPGDSNSITFNPCCLYDEYLPFHPTVYKKQREKFIASDQDFLPHCSKCKLKEKTHNQSHRLFANRDIPDGIGSDIYKIEFVLDTTCNAACIQCGTLQSSLWRNEVARRDKTYQHIQPKEQIDSKIDLIFNSVNINTVKEFHFWGGEPLLTDTHLKVIDRINDPSSVTLRYTTNGSIFPSQDVLKRWEKFKTVIIGLSLDDVGDRFYYIRWPLKWDKITRNMLKFRDNVPNNVGYFINCCIIPLNVYYVHDLLEWAETSIRNPDGSKVSVNYIRGEGTLDISCTPQNMRDDILKTLPNSHPITNMLLELPVTDASYMLSHLNMWDPIRKLNWRETFPDIVKYFE